MEVITAAVEQMETSARFHGPFPSVPFKPAEIGDFDETQSWQHLLHNKYLPDQDAIRDKIIDSHRKHV